MPDKTEPISVPFRVGQGFDVHPWSDDPERTLVLGGVSFPGHRSLVGHSDSDVVAHACIDAILGAAGLGDIGEMFPDTAAEHSGANSLDLLAEAVRRVNRSGWVVANIDCTIICDSPKLAPVKEQMMSNLSSIVNAPVSVKGKRTEGIDGLSGGIQGHAVALVVKQ